VSPKTEKPQIDALVRSIRALLVDMLDEGRFTPNTFREVHEIAEAAHTMISKVDPILNVPKTMPGSVLAGAPSSETYGAKLGRELIQMFDKLTGNRKAASRLDLVKAISYAELHDMQEEADGLREELFGEEADEMQQEAGRLLEEIRPNVVD